MMKRMILAGACGLALAGCDAATQIAGETVEGEARNAIAAQCRQVAEGAGIAAGRVAEVCECSAETVLADRDVSLANLSRARVEEIVNGCARNTGAVAGGGQSLSTEEAGG
jgi:hypothetical protein